MVEQLPELIVADATAWREWLEAHHASASGAWLVLAKRGATDPTSLTYEQAVNEALCFGWIDGQARRRDETTSSLRFTPRRARSVWSKKNVERVGRLIEEGRLHPAGLAQVERAKADGRWEAAYAGPATIEMPDDLATALAAQPAAQAMYDRLTSQNRFAVLYRVHSAKRPETRARRIAQYVEMLGRGETIYPQRRRAGE